MDKCTGVRVRVVAGSGVGRFACAELAATVIEGSGCKHPVAVLSFCSSQLLQNPLGALMTRISDDTSMGP